MRRGRTIRQTPEEMRLTALRIAHPAQREKLEMLLKNPAWRVYAWHQRDMTHDVRRLTAAVLGQEAAEKAWQPEIVTVICVSIETAANRNVRKAAVVYPDGYLLHSPKQNHVASWNWGDAARRLSESQIEQAKKQ